MAIISIALVIMAITLLVVAAFAIPVLVEVRKTAVTAREFITRQDTELQPVLRELRETLADLKVLTRGAAESLDEAQIFMGAVGDAGRNLRTVNTVLGGVATVLGSSSAWLTGARVAGSFLFNKLSRKGGRTDG